MTLEETVKDFVVSTKDMFRETDLRFKETDLKFKETEKLLNEKFTETSLEISKLKDMFKETDKMLSERFAETDKKIRNLTDKVGEFNSNWGKLIEAMVKPGVLKMFQERGIEVTECFPNVIVNRNGYQKEFDLILVNGGIVIVVEVKTTLRSNHIRRHIKALENFTYFMPEHSDKKIYGAVAFIRSHEESWRLALHEGMFVLSLTGRNLIEIKNDKTFQPVDFRV